MKTPRFTIALVLLALMVNLTAADSWLRTVHAGYLPDSPQEMRDRVAGHIARTERPMLLGLFHWANVDSVTRAKVEDEVDRLLNGEVESIELAEIPPGVPQKFSRNGKSYEMNLTPALMLVVAVVEAKGVAKIGFPLGITPEGYALAVTVPEPRPYQSPTRKKNKLSIRVSADAQTTTEVVCSYYVSIGGRRKIVSFKGSGSFAEDLRGESFDSCAAKKRSGPGISEVSLIQDGSEIFRDQAADIDDPMIYRIR